MLYEKECRMELGCAIVQSVGDNNSDLPCEGRRYELFDYTSKALISLTDYQKMMASEIATVQKRSSTSKKRIEKEEMIIKIMLMRKLID